MRRLNDGEKRELPRALDGKRAIPGPEHFSLEAVCRRFDAVYFLMFPGWKTELRSNRWHYATRWARHLPVTLVQPDLDTLQRDGEVEAEPRIANSRILHVRHSNCAASYGTDSFLQTSQLRRDLRRQRYKKVLLWLYNPFMVGTYSMLSSAGRVQHATENYFGFPSLQPFLRDSMEISLSISDHVIAVSQGVTAAVRRHAPTARVSEVSNGCDYAFYKSGRPDEEVLALHGQWTKIIVFAGNINGRLDFPLIEAACNAKPEMAFLFVGPVAPLAEDKGESWRRVAALPNASHLGAVEAERLPDIYAAADLGIIPYENSPLMRDSFPLKALEMAACGLPVVTSEIPELRNQAYGVRVTGTPAEFVEAVGSMSRQRLSAAQSVELDELARAHDYDGKFLSMLRSISGSVGVRNNKREREQRVARCRPALWEKLFLAPPPPRRFGLRERQDRIRLPARSLRLLLLLRRRLASTLRLLLLRLIELPALAPLRRALRGSMVHRLVRRLL